MLFVIIIGRITQQTVQQNITAGLLLSLSVLDCIISELDYLCIQVLYLVAVDGKHDLNDFVSLYEKDLVDKYLLDQ